MFYDENQAISACEGEPSLIFELIKEEHFDIVDKLISKHKIDINVCDDNGNDVLMRLLRKGQFNLVLKYIKDKTWNCNHQNNEGNTFMHILVTLNGLQVLEIVKKLKKRKEFLPNLKNNKGETILDLAITSGHINTTTNILEDKRFNSIDIASFKKFYDKYINTNQYGKYTKLANLHIIIDSLDEKELVPRMQKLVDYFKKDYTVIESEVINNKSKKVNKIINTILRESNAY